MKTIFITSFNPFVTRNILFTDVSRIVKNTPDVRVVIFCPDYKKDYFLKNFSGSNIVIEGIQSQRVTKQDAIFNYLGRSLNRTNTLALHRKEIFLRNKNIFAYFLSHLLSWVGWFSPVKKIVRFCDQLTIVKTKFAPYFEKYKPDLIFAPDVFHSDDVHFLAEAKYRGIRTIGMVRSWDNITNKGLFRIKPNALIVNNEVICNEAMQYEDMKPKDIFIAGMPQLDYYFNESRSNREEFFRRIGFNSQKPLILFSPWGDRFIDTDWKILQILKEARNSGEIPADSQFLVRFPPNDTVSLGDFIPDDNFRIEQPAQSFQEGVARDQELDHDAMTHLADSLHYSNLVIAYTSSLNIDACSFDKPIVGVAFDGEKDNQYLKSAVRFLDFDHTQKMLFTDWAPFVRNKKDFIKNINLCFQNPDLRKKERAHFLRLQAWKTDGKSGERIGNFLLSQIAQQRSPVRR